MLQENIRALRREKGFSQEELASRLSVVRQTVSKWEKGLSVPDAEMLLKLAEVFEVPASRLLGETIDPQREQTDLQKLAQKLEDLNADLARQRARSRKRTRIVAKAAIAAGALWMAAGAVLFLDGLYRRHSAGQGEGIIGGADGPTAIWVAASPDWLGSALGFLLGTVLLTGAAILLWRNRK